MKKVQLKKKKRARASILLTAAGFMAVQIVLLSHLMLYYTSQMKTLQLMEQAQEVQLLRTLAESKKKETPDLKKYQCTLGKAIFLDDQPKKLRKIEITLKTGETHHFEYATTPFEIEKEKSDSK